MSYDKNGWKVWAWEENGETMFTRYCAKHFVYHPADIECAICTREAVMFAPVLNEVETVLAIRTTNSTGIPTQPERPKLDPSFYQACNARGASLGKINNSGPHKVDCKCADCRMKRAAAVWNEVEMQNYEKERKEFAKLKAQYDAVCLENAKLTNSIEKYGEDIRQQEAAYHKKEIKALQDEIASLKQYEKDCAQSHYWKCSKGHLHKPNEGCPVGNFTGVQKTYIPNPLDGISDPGAYKDLVYKNNPFLKLVNKQKEDPWEVDEWDLLPDAD